MRKMLLAGAAMLAGAFGQSALAQPRGEGANDLAASTTTTGRISPGQSRTGTVSAADDRDWYRIRLQAGRAYHFTLNGDGASPLSDPYLALIGPEGGEPIAFNDDGPEGLNSVLDFTPIATGNYFLDVRGFGETQGGYVLAAARDSGRPPAATASLAVGESVTGSIAAAGERDRYRVSLAAGQTYRISLISAGEPAMSDPFVSLYAPTGSSPVASDDDSGGNFNSYIEYTAPSAGDYVLEARSFNADATGGYTLSIRAGEIAGDASTDITLNAADGETRSDRLNPAGDSDWYRVELTAGQSIRVLLNSGAEDSAPLGDPLLVLHGPDGAELARDDDGGEGLNSYLEFSAPNAGAYFIEARSFAEDATGGYALIVRPGEIPNSVRSDETLSPQDPRESAINAASDSDWFGVEMIEGRTYRFNLESAEGENALADPMLALYNAEGVQIASDDDGGAGADAYLSFTSPTNGTYYAAASALGGQATGRYRLRVSDTEVPGDLNTDETLAGDGDSRASRIDFVNDRDAYRVSVRPGQRYRVRVARAEQHGLGDPFVTVLNQRGEELGQNDDERRGSRNAAFTFTAPTVGSRDDAVVYAVASGFEGSTGDYTISVEPAPAPRTTPKD